MRKIGILLIGMIISFISFGQQKEFEGIITYKVTVKSKKPEFDDKYWKNIMGSGDIMTINIKQGNYLRQSGIVSEYYSSKEEKVYIKFNGIDTLFYRNYSSDTSSVINISKTNDTKKIMGYDCKSIVIKTSAVTNKYYYAPQLYANPIYNKNNKIGRFDAFINETSSVWLSEMSDYGAFTTENICTNIDQKPVDESNFKLPDLPRVEYDFKYFLKPAEFGRSIGLKKYLETNLKADLGAKYLKIPKGESEVIQTVIVLFTVSRTGEVTNVEVVNKKEVHPKLAEEAMRVISESGKWKPATFLGERTPYMMKQPITFAVSKR